MVKPTKQKFYYVEDVCRMLELKERSAYNIIRKLNKELEEKGYFVVRGRVSVKYFEERYNLELSNE